jgi:aryl-alcohol dehydrogenase-like predicted oxidoreductase
MSSSPDRPGETRLSRRALLALMAAGAAGLGAGGAPIVRAIPASRETVPVIGLGTWQTFDVSGAAELARRREILEAFAQLGGRVVDSSPMYGRAEAVVGELATALSVRNRLFLATKVWTRGRQPGVAQMETSQRRLRTDVIDLMQVHNLVDWRTHLATLREWKAAGRIRYLGVTHYTASAHGELAAILEAEPVDFVQVNYSLAERDAERRLLPLAAERGVAVVVNRPFAEGALFRRVRGKALPGWAAELGCHSWAQLFLKWIVAHPAVTCVIPATSRPEHLRDNMQAGVGPLPDAAARGRLAALVA